jgi:hypothetical protein
LSLILQQLTDFNAVDIETTRSLLMKSGISRSSSGKILRILPGDISISAQLGFTPPPNKNRSADIVGVLTKVTPSCIEGRKYLR